MVDVVFLLGYVVGFVGSLCLIGWIVWKIITSIHKIVVRIKEGKSDEKRPA